MANLRDIKRRIGSVKNTRQITRAMKMVSASKLKRAQARAEGAKPYAVSLDRVLRSVLASAGDDVEHPLLTEHPQVNRVRVIVMGSDKGLCGGFNGILNRRTEAWIRETFLEQGTQVEVDTFGKKARAHFASRPGFRDSVIDLKSSDFVEYAQDLATVLTPDFESGEVHEVYLAYNVFESVMTQTPTFKRLLPMEVGPAEQASTALGAEGAAEAEYKYEPNGAVLLNTLLPLQLQTLILQGFFDSEAGEQASRMTAMDSATNNANDLVDALTLQFNRARQAAITTQIIEIVSGAEAL